MTQVLEAAIASTRAVLANVKADDMGSSTPCASWKVSDIVNHVVGGQHFFASAVRGQAPAGDPPDFSSSDYVGTFDQNAAEAVAAFSEDGAMERTVHLPFGDFPGAAWMNIAALDTFVHGWDLAKATGQDTNLSPGLATGLLAGAKQMIPDQFRGPDTKAPFGPEVAAPAGASAADQLAAFLGRTV
jgi:uncharacterized protein (TIGR03086 family)